MREKLVKVERQKAKVKKWGSEVKGDNMIVVEDFAFVRIIFLYHPGDADLRQHDGCGSEFV